jgi:hypothetical protein
LKKPDKGSVAVNMPIPNNRVDFMHAFPFIQVGACFKSRLKTVCNLTPYGCMFGPNNIPGRDNALSGDNIPRRDIILTNDNVPSDDNIPRRDIILTNDNVP